MGCVSEERRMCRLGCNKPENSYHVATACPVPAFTTRHDNAINWILKTNLQHTDAPPEVCTNIRFGQANVALDYNKIKLRAGQKWFTGS